MKLNIYFRLLLLDWISFHSPLRNRLPELAQTLSKLEGLLPPHPSFAVTIVVNTVSNYVCYAELKLNSFLIFKTYVSVYLDVPSTDLTTDIQLTFNFARTATPSSRLWNIKIALLPCGAPYLGNKQLHNSIYPKSSWRNTVHMSFIFTAPVDCLQYFTSPSGRISSFNWKDVPVTAVRQLNNQNYNACFRTELINRQVTILLIRNFPFFTD